MQADLREQVDKLIADYSEAEGTSVKRALIAEIKLSPSFRRL